MPSRREKGAYVCYVCKEDLTAALIEQIGKLPVVMMRTARVVTGRPPAARSVSKRNPSAKRKRRIHVTCSKDHINVFEV